MTLLMNTYQHYNAYMTDLSLSNFLDFVVWSVAINPSNAEATFV